MTLRVLGPFGLVSLCFFLLLTSGGALWAEQSNPEDEAAALVGAFRDAMYLQQVDDGELYQAYRMVRADLGGLALNDRQFLYWKAQATYYMARGYQALDSIEAVLDHDVLVRKGKFKKMQKSYSRLDELVALYEEALALLEEYLEGGRDGRGVGLYAECLSQLSTLKNLGFLMSNGPKGTSLAEEALELDDTNVKAKLILASRYVYSPGVWGGDPDKGIAMLEQIEAAGGLDREDVHNIAIAKGFAHTMAERWSEAIPFFTEALEVYPTNIYAEAMLRLSESGGN